MKTLLLIVIVVAGLWLWSEHQTTPLLSCTVAEIGTAASVTVNGYGAWAWCDQQIISNSADRGFTWYKTPDRPADVLVCQYPIKGLTFVVRDRGTFFVVGSQLCAEFKTRYEALPK